MAQAQQQADPSALVPFPGQAASRILVDDQWSGEESAGEGDVAAVALTYESPALGPINLRIGMNASSVVAEVRVGAGAPLEMARAASGALQQSLAERTERAATVSVVPRPGSFDVSA
jgi:hypothetical protein